MLMDTTEAMEHMLVVTTETHLLTTHIRPHIAPTHQGILIPHTIPVLNIKVAITNPAQALTFKAITKHIQTDTHITTEKTCTAIDSLPFLKTQLRYLRNIL